MPSPPAAALHPLAKSRGAERAARIEPEQTVKLHASRAPTRASPGGIDWAMTEKICGFVAGQVRKSRGSSTTSTERPGVLGFEPARIAASTVKPV